MVRQFSAVVASEMLSHGGAVFVAQCLDIDLASQGATEEEALANLREAIQLHFAKEPAARAPAVHRIEVDLPESAS